MDPHALARQLAVGRIVIGGGLVAAPALAARGWVGDVMDTPGARVLARGFGARDLAIGAGAFSALRSGQPVVDWMLAGALCDFADLAATLGSRHALPPLERYAHLALDGQERPVGYVEASHGCVHKCAHCPLPVIYDGRIRIVEGDVVLADIEQLVEMGARHITFGDPDFLNGVTHSLRVVRAMHERFPDLTFDCTTKVEHILEHAQVWPELAANGCLFVVSALECVNDEILARLDKGHSTEEASHAIALLREHGIEIRPSFLPFTPWT